MKLCHARGELKRAGSQPASQEGSHMSMGVVCQFARVRVAQCASVLVPVSASTSALLHFPMPALFLPVESFSAYC